MDRVHSRGAELCDLVVGFLPVLLVLELLPAVGHQATPIPHTDKAGCESIQLEEVSSLLVCGDPGLTEMNDVCLQDGGVNPQILHVWIQPGNVEGGYPDLGTGIILPLPWIIVQAPG